MNKNIEEREALSVCFLITKETKKSQFWKHARKAFAAELGHDDFIMKKQYEKDGNQKYVCYYTFIDKEEFNE